MYHEQLVMKKNKRMKLRDIDSFELNPVARLQMILGSNGSGKSTVLDALSLQPALPAHYDRGGIQSHTVTHRGSRYELRYDFTGVKNHYSISKDGVEVYSGHVSSACTQYVSEHLGLTREVHEICTGRKRFTKMSTSDRRAWFTKLSPIDYTYALSYYKRLGDAHRDLEGSIKRQSNRLAQERDKAIDDTKADQIRQEMAKLKNAKEEMIKQWTPVNLTMDEAISQVDAVDQKLSELHANYMRSIRVFSDRGEFKTVEDVRRLDGEVRGRIAFHRASMDKLYNQIDENRGLIAKSQYLASQDMQEVDDKIRQCQESINRAEHVLTFKGYSNNEAAHTALVNIWHELIKTLGRIDPDPHNHISDLSIQRLEEGCANLQLQIQNLNWAINQFNDQIHKWEHRTAEDMINCPKCSHSFTPGLGDQGLDEAKLQLKLKFSERDRVEKHLQECEKKLKYENEQRALHKYLFMMVQSTHGALAPLWDTLMDDNVLKGNPGKSIMLLEVARTDLQELLEADKARVILKDLYQLREMSEKNAGVNLQDLQSKNAVLEKELYDHQLSSQSLNKRLEILMIIQKEWKIQDDTFEALERLKVSRDYAILQAEEANKKIVINSILGHIDQELLMHERAISQIDSHKAVIKSLEADVDEYTRKAKLLKKSMDALSPKKGLIAKGLTGFINHFIEQMNAVISKVWLYPLRISPVEIKGDEDSTVDLDYSFTYTYDDNPGADDVKDASGAQKEIFDLAFMLVSMKHLGMDDYPIFLDEFSVNMDYAHRKEAMKLVLDLLNSSNFSQIFMVSHYEGSYGSLNNADITVLCPENIEIPAGMAYNVNATISHA